MKFDRRFSLAATDLTNTADQQQDAYANFTFNKRTSEIRQPNGEIIFQAKDVGVPDSWSQVAVDVLAQKYFRKAGVPAILKKVEENDVPSWLWRSEADHDALARLPEN